MYRTPRLVWKSYKDYPIKERMVSMVNIIKQEIVIEEKERKIFESRRISNLFNKKRNQ